MKFLELYRRSFATRITLAVAGMATVLSISQLALFYSLVGVKLRDAANFGVDVRHHHRRHDGPAGGLRADLPTRWSAAS